jgi:hypothetical protein
VSSCARQHGRIVAPAAKLTCADLVLNKRTVWRPP